MSGGCIDDLYFFMFSIKVECAEEQKGGGLPDEDGELSVHVI